MKKSSLGCVSKPCRTGQWQKGQGTLPLEDPVCQSIIVPDVKGLGINQKECSQAKAVAPAEEMSCPSPSATREPRESFPTEPC